MQRKRALDWFTAILVILAFCLLVGLAEVAAARTPVVVAALLFVVALGAMVKSEF